MSHANRRSLLTFGALFTLMLIAAAVLALDVEDEAAPASASAAIPVSAAK